MTGILKSTSTIMNEYKLDVDLNFHAKPKSLLDPRAATDEETEYLIKRFENDYAYENGRLYYRPYKNDYYLLPVDSAERDRLDMQFFILKILLNGKNFLSPADKLTTGRILDVGSGTGKWACEVANQFPKAEVYAFDICPNQMTLIPSNVHFYMSDANSNDWGVKTNSFDLVHMQMMHSSFEDYEKVLQSAYGYVKSGGWMECRELLPTWYSDDDSIPDNWCLNEWTQLQNRAAILLKRPLRIAIKLKRLFEEIGYEDVHELVLKIPLNSWPNDLKWSLIGHFQKELVLNGLEPLSLAYFHRAYGWTSDEIDSMITRTKTAVFQSEVHAYQKLYVVWGRKP